MVTTLSRTYVRLSGLLVEPEEPHGVMRLAGLSPRRDIHVVQQTPAYAPLIVYVGGYGVVREASHSLLDGEF